jgi:hypothetical protein
MASVHTEYPPTVHRRDRFGQAPAWHDTCAYTSLMEQEKTDTEGERVAEQSEGISRKRRGSPAAPSDKPEPGLPHPQDTNEIGDPT